MKVTAAVLRKAGEPFALEDVELEKIKELEAKLGVALVAVK